MDRPGYMTTADDQPKACSAVLDCAGYDVVRLPTPTRTRAGPVGGDFVANPGLMRYVVSPEVRSLISNPCMRPSDRDLGSQALDYLRSTHRVALRSAAPNERGSDIIFQFKWNGRSQSVEVIAKPLMPHARGRCNCCHGSTFVRHERSQTSGGHCAGDSDHRGRARYCGWAGKEASRCVTLWCH
ncbi:hypothetical protein BD309DRAFT_966352 [Dichomitus squalens]|nr:hypothetical protein BD309DRAFT_966352 [Dichomitus squalens]